MVLVLAIATYLAKATELEKTPTISLYFHDTPKKCNSNVKVIPVAHIAGKAWNVPKSGTGTVIVIGHAKGMGSKGLDSRVSISIKFTNEEYKGSTIEIQGISKQFMHGTEVLVVGGTGKFRFARGYATFKEEHLDIPNQYTIIQT
ncbi:hypothetical protein ACB098_06G065200 [Castanea mollissima]